LQGPSPGFGERETRLCRQWSLDELRLTARADRRHDRQPGDRVGRRGAVVRPDHVQAQVDAGRQSRGGENRAVLDEQHVRFESYGGVAAPEHVRFRPVRGGALVIEQACLRQDEGAGADRRDALACRRRVAQGGQDGWWNVLAPGSAGHHHRVGLDSRFEAVVDVNVEGAVRRQHSGLGGADLDVVRGLSVDLDRTEDQFRNGQIGGGDRGTAMTTMRCMAGTSGSVAFRPLL
jgi:hypothetical protein